MMSFFSSLLTLFMVGNSFVFAMDKVGVSFFQMNDVFNGQFFTLCFANGANREWNPWLFILSSLLLSYTTISILKNSRKDLFNLKLSSILLFTSSDEEKPKDLVIRNKVYMPREKEHAILESLLEYEANKFFLNKDLCLNQLAIQSGIDERYITHVIKKYRGKDFATYVNELRVCYIANCLQEDPAYLGYKISYLASKCGFTSHSGFTISFKKVFGVSPSEFINELKNEFSEL